MFTRIDGSYHWVSLAFNNNYKDSLRYWQHIAATHLHTLLRRNIQSFRPNAEVALGVAGNVGANSEECTPVAGHLSDLKSAKACGFYTVYVERLLEGDNLELRDETILATRFKRSTISSLLLSGRKHKSSDSE